MLSPKLQNGLNQLIQKELLSSHAYNTMAAWAGQMDCDSPSYVASRLRNRSKEETEHARNLLEYMSDRGAGVRLPWFPCPEKSFIDIADLLEQQLRQESQMISALKELHTIAAEDKDSATLVLLERFIQEHVAAEHLAASMLEQNYKNQEQKQESSDLSIRQIQLVHQGRGKSCQNA